MDNGKGELSTSNIELPTSNIESDDGKAEHATLSIKSADREFLNGERLFNRSRIGVTSGHKTERLARRVTHSRQKAAKSKVEIGKAAQ